jgi:hypothetical protein
MRGMNVSPMVVCNYIFCGCGRRLPKPGPAGTPEGRCSRCNESLRFVIQAFDETENQWFALAAESRYDAALKEAKRIAWRRDDEVRVVDTALKCEPWQSNVVGTYGPEHYEGPR